MREMTQAHIDTQGRSRLPGQKIVARRRRKKYLIMMRQKEIDAMVEFTRNQLMDRYED